MQQRILWLGGINVAPKREWVGMEKSRKYSEQKPNACVAAGAARAIDMVRFFDISNQMCFLVKSLTVQKKPFFLIFRGIILKINRKEKS